MGLVYLNRRFLSSLFQKTHLTLSSLCIHKPHFLDTDFLASWLASSSLTFTSAVIKVDPR